jgi:membrane protease YdiL (CAAX protease family)
MQKQVDDPIHLKDASIFKRGLFLTCGIFIALIFSLLTGLVISLYEVNTYLSIGLGIVVLIMYSGFAYGLYRAWQNISIDYDFRKKGMLTKSNLKLLSIAVLVMIIIHFFVSFMSKESTIILNQNTFNIVSVFLFHVILAPIVEELLCRGIFLSIFFRKTNRIYERLGFDANKTNMLLGIIVSAYLSTILHGISSWPVLITLFTNGVIASVLYYKSKHVATSIVFHFINNAVAWISFILL